ncbi:hypothetical protein MGYG_04263 [Nannizzia gypsea CBS 118893]|uniref:Uncharacterized protein n=1 Tax=Arthroderma gypseum (strain ATCC MYA-4604 / CBS 118893) TaxID=535722 RepID=E4US01_ARTGP|nr:hypothetical protein MGYG_04263 [Nannizzia gypsea CBS 118893]EFR01258.1 hypothetical protein MGYG_04263 [Nannizzia gypsea CBS 118893]
MSEGHFHTSAVSYAGPLLTPKISEELPSKPPRRTKQREGSSEDDGPAILGDTELRNEDYRCGGPNLVRLPALSEVIKSSEPIRILFEKELIGPLRDVLEKWNVDSQYINVVRRYSVRARPEAPAATVIVSAKKHELDNSWLLACRGIRDLFLEHGQATLQIEISDGRALEPIISQSIPRHDPFAHAWPELQSQILAILSDMEWTLLTVLLRGPPGGPFIPTIVICVREDSLQNWNDTRDTIVQHLDSNYLTHITVEILRDSIFHCSDQEGTLDERDWDMKAKLGGSLGLRGKSTSSFTFGGFLELEFSHGQWRKYGVTNFHCVANDKHLDDWKKHGILPGDSRNYLSVDHPSLADHSMSIRYYENKATRIRTESYYEIKKRLEDEDPSLSENTKTTFNYDTDRLNGYIKKVKLANAFHQQGNRYLGGVYAASGYRISTTSRMLDWALIEVRSERLSKNKIPLMEDIPESRRGEYHPASAVLQAATPVEADMSLCKVGRRTGFTEGRLNTLHVTQVQKWSQNKDGSWTKICGSLHEIVPVAPQGRFGDAGDSGSFIMDRHGSFVGLYVGGCLETGTGYFMEASDLFHDIEKITGATNVRVP